MFIKILFPVASIFSFYFIFLTQYFFIRPANSQLHCTLVSCQMQFLIITHGVWQAKGYHVLRSIKSSTYRRVKAVFSVSVWLLGCVVTCFLIIIIIKCIFYSVNWKLNKVALIFSWIICLVYSYFEVPTYYYYDSMCSSLLKQSL